MSDWKFSEGGRYVKLCCKMGRRMKKVENHCATQTFAPAAYHKQ